MRLSVVLACCLVCSYASAETPKYLLKADLTSGKLSSVTVKLEVGGDMLVSSDKEGSQQLPLKVVGELKYREQLVCWSADPQSIARSIRQYDSAIAQIEVAEQSTERTLQEDQNCILAEIREGMSILTGGDANLTRKQLDLVNEVGNTLAIDRLLPGKEMAEGESWTHDPEVLKALLCMDHVAVCEVSSVVTEMTDRQVKLRLAGIVHGTVDGTATELELRAAYLFHLDEKRITRFNLAIKEARKQSDIVPGLDVVAKAFITIDSETNALDVPADVQEIAAQVTEPLSRTLEYQPPAKNFRFKYHDAWYITAEERDRLSLRYLEDHELTAHCNLTVLPARSAGRHTPLEEFEKDVRKSLGDKLKSVIAATEWETQRGHHCLGVVSQGEIDGVPIEWRNYLVSADNCPRLSLSVTLERERVEWFADAERQIIDSIELVPTPAATTASKPEAVNR